MLEAGITGAKRAAMVFHSGFFILMYLFAGVELICKNVIEKIHILPF